MDVLGYYGCNCLNSFRKSHFYPVLQVRASAAQKEAWGPPTFSSGFDVPWSHLHKMLLWVVVKLLFLPQETRKSGKNDVFWVCSR